MPSIRDVARLAGVSHQTVSRVLNEHPSIRQATKERVLEAIERLDYRPNQAARALVTSRLKLIGVISATVGEHGPTSSQAAIDEAARAAGYSVTTLNLPDTGAESIGNAVRQLIREQVDGIIVMAPQQRVFNILRALSITVPYVSLNSEPATANSRHAPEQVAGAALAVEHLVERGHREILHVAGPQDWIEADSRMQGYLDALGRADLPVHPPLQGDWTADYGYFIGREFAFRRDITAVFAANDFMAIGLMHGMRDGGRAVPGEISVIGFDDIPIAAHVWPPLSSISIDHRGRGRFAVARLLAAIEDGGEAVDVSEAPRLVVRASSQQSVS